MVSKSDGCKGNPLISIETGFTRRRNDATRNLKPENRFLSKTKRLLAYVLRCLDAATFGAFAASLREPGLVAVEIVAGSFIL